MESSYFAGWVSQFRNSKLTDDDDGDGDDGVDDDDSDDEDDDDSDDEGKKEEDRGRSTWAETITSFEAELRLQREATRRRKEAEAGERKAEVTEAQEAKDVDEGEVTAILDAVIGPIGQDFLAAEPAAALAVAGGGGGGGGVPTDDGSSFSQRISGLNKKAAGRAGEMTAVRRKRGSGGSQIDTLTPSSRTQSRHRIDASSAGREERNSLAADGGGRRGSDVFRGDKRARPPVIGGAQRPGLGIDGEKRGPRVAQESVRNLRMCTEEDVLASFKLLKTPSKVTNEQSFGLADRKSVKLPKITKTP